MTEKEYLKRLKKSLGFLDYTERESVLEYYREMIEDKIENGSTEAQAVSELEAPEIVAARSKELKSGDGNGKKKSLPLILALVIGSPVWIALAIAAAAVAISVIVTAVALATGLAAGGAAVAINGIIELFFDLSLGIGMTGIGAFSFAAGVLGWIGIIALTKTVIKKFKKEV